MKSKLKLVTYNEREATELVLASLCWLRRTTFLAVVLRTETDKIYLQKSQGHCIYVGKNE